MESDFVDELRLSFKPSKISLLFVGESPPAGEKFFYKANSNLYYYTQKAFSLAFGPKCGHGADFLKFFKDHGCYLDDLCLRPVNNVKNKAMRNNLRKEEIGPLADRIRAYEPSSIIAVMLAIAGHVKESANIVGLTHIPFYSLPFPASGRHKRYVAELTSVLRDLRKSKRI